MRYLPLDRLSVRPRTGPASAPGLGLACLRPSLLCLPPGCSGALALSSGGRTHYLAVPTPADAVAWVEAVGSAWEACIFDGGPRSLLMTSNLPPLESPPSAAAAAAAAASSAWATAAAEPPSAPAATPRGEDGYSTPPVRAWR